MRIEKNHHPLEDMRGNIAMKMRKRLKYLTSFLPQCLLVRPIVLRIPGL